LPKSTPDPGLFAAVYRFGVNTFVLLEILVWPPALGD